MRLTGSKLYLAEACPASHTLPAAYSASGVDASIGTTIHAYLCTDVLPSNGARQRCEVIDLAKARPESSGVDEREVSFAYDVMSGSVRRLGVGLSREYGELADTEIALTVDRVWDDRGLVQVDDYKTGQHAPDAEDNAQLGLGAVCVAGHLHVDTIATSIVHIHEDGRVWRDRVVLDAFDLEATAQRLRSIWQRVDRARSREIPDTHPGEHCQYCPAMHACPAHAGIVKRFAELDVEVLTTEDVGRAWVQLAAAQEWLAKVESAIKLRIDREGSVPLPAGGVVRPVVQQRASVDVDAAWTPLREAGIDPDAIVKRTLGIGDVEKAAKAAGVKDVRDLLNRAGALKLASITTYRKAKS